MGELCSILYLCSIEATTFKLQLSSQAKRELGNTVLRYKREDLTLGAKFHCEFLAFIDIIKSCPELFHENENGLRTVRLGSDFPYEIDYSLDTEAQEITIASIAHQSRRNTFQ